MKKAILLACMLVPGLARQLQAQTIFSDDFSNQALPNWTIVNEASQGGSTVVWAWSNNPTSGGGAPGTFQHAGAANGHIIVDSDLNGDQGGTVQENTSITSHAINCTGLNTVVLSFFEYYTKFQMDTARVYVSTDSVNWTLVHNSSAGLVPNQESNNPNYVEEDVSAIAANQPTVYIRFNWKGAWDYWWFVDDVKLFVPDNNNAEATAAYSPLTNGCNLSATEPIGIVFRNKGLADISSIVVKYSVNGGTPVSETVAVAPALPYDSVYSYTFTTPADLSAQNIYNITAWVELAGDTANANDTAFSVSISANPIDLTTPYTTGFEFPPYGNDVSALTWTTEDANGDDNTWQYTGTVVNAGTVAFRYMYNFDGQTGADDWLYSPCLTMSSTKAYKISFFDHTGIDDNGIYPEKLELKAGTTKSSTGLTQTIEDFGTIVDSEYVERKVAFKPSTSGTYYVGFHAYSDADEWYINIDDVTIAVLNAPNAQFAVNQNGSTITVTDGSDDMITDWTWNWGDNTTNGNGQDPGAHTYAAPGTYQVCLVVTNLAGSDTLCQNVTIAGVGIKETTAENIMVYPNPAKDVINVMLSEGLKTNGKIEVVDAIGQTLLTKTAGGNSIETINLQKLPQGVYFIRLSTAEGVKAIKKFVYVP